MRQPVFPRLILFLVFLEGILVPQVVIPKNPIKRGKDGLMYVHVAKGTFRMGCSPNEIQCAPEEKPAHKVTLTKGFWIGQTEVTVEAYKGFVTATGRSMPPEPKYARTVTVRVNPNWAEAQQPITMVSWNDATAYCEWAGGRLLTEAEWEYAARAGETSPRYGSPDEIAWYADNSGESRIDTTAIRDSGKPHMVDQALNGNRSHPVGLKKPNRIGLFDMVGNVFEWVADWDGPYSDKDQIDPMGPPSGKERVIRSSGYMGLPWTIRLSMRTTDPQPNFDSVIGIRCALDED